VERKGVFTLSTFHFLLLFLKHKMLEPRDFHPEARAFFWLVYWLRVYWLTAVGGATLKALMTDPG
jgi:hypothetical protein